ncbi:hypothetical protein ID866_1870 [Astraeus odoratus]|nr:hypothetical protein ID866_1870 [Astraeus odoratus]
MIFVGIAAGLATAVPAPYEAACPCMGGGGEQSSANVSSTVWAATGAVQYTGSWGAQTASVATTASTAQYTAAWASPATTSCATSAVSTAGGGMTHTVVVAPTQGILRYVPFVVNASVGDTVDFIWNANNHTVTKSSQLAICNKTTDAPFTSGEQNKSFVYRQTVNDTNSTYFYCGTPGHCPKGMFGIINPPNAAMGSNASLSSMMPAMAANSSGMAAMWQYTQMMTQNSTMAASWGGNIDMSTVPEWAQQYVAENVMYTRTFLAVNPETFNADGSVSLANAGSTPLKVPVDITSVQNSSAPSAGGSSGSSPASPSSSSSSTDSNPYPTSTSSAGRFTPSVIFSGFAATFVLVSLL